jgi:hypothetical protein
MKCGSKYVSRIKNKTEFNTIINIIVLKNKPEFNTIINIIVLKNKINYVLLYLSFKPKRSKLCFFITNSNGCCLISL